MWWAMVTPMYLREPLKNTRGGGYFATSPRRFFFWGGGLNPVPQCTMDHLPHRVQACLMVAWPPTSAPSTQSSPLKLVCYNLTQALLAPRAYMCEMRYDGGRPGSKALGFPKHAVMFRYMLDRGAFGLTRPTQPTKLRTRGTGGDQTKPVLLESTMGFFGGGHGWMEGHVI